MRIGVPLERKTLEKRVALTPDGVRELRRYDHEVMIERGAGIGSFFTDEEYLAAGAKLVDSLAKVWEADLVVKVKEPDEKEYSYFREDQILFDYLHLASSETVTKALLKGKITSVAYELVTTEDKRLPLLEPMSEIAGKLSVLNGSYFLLSQNGGRGILTGGALGVDPAKVVIVGGGIAGRGASEMAIGMGANTTVLDIDVNKLEKLRTEFGSRARLLYSSKGILEREISEADLVIGAVLIPGAQAPKIVTDSMVQRMRPGSVIIDISVDQGGCVATTKVTSLETPTFVEHGVIHYGVPNMPAQTPRTSTLALTSSTLPYIIAIANGGLEAIKGSSRLRGAVNTYKGTLTNKEVAEAHRLEVEEF
jgi:alanine dehydrogenase